MKRDNLKPHLAKGVVDFVKGKIAAKEFQKMLYCLGSVSLQSGVDDLQQSFIELYKKALEAGQQPKIKMMGLFTFFSLCPVEQSQDVFRIIKGVYLDMIDEIVKELGEGIMIEFDEPILAKETSLNTLRCVYKRSAIECIYQVIPEKGVQAIVNPPLKEQK